jgi:hypothetical protein
MSPHPQLVYPARVGLDDADPPKSLPPIPVRVSRRSQLTAAFRQHARLIVIEDQNLAGPFVRLLRARELRLWGLGEFVANTMQSGKREMVPDAVTWCRPGSAAVLDTGSPAAKKQPRVSGAES